MNNALDYHYSLSSKFGTTKVFSRSHLNSVGVIDSKGKHKHLYFDGEIEEYNAKYLHQKGTAFLTYFYGATAFMRPETEQWINIDIPNVLIGLVMKEKCYVITQMDGPYICTPSDSLYSIVRNKKFDANHCSSKKVISLEKYKQQKLR